MLILSFLYSVINNDDNISLFKVKDHFFVAKDRPLLEFVQDYYADYSKLPDLLTVENKFGVQLIDNTETPAYWIKEIIASYQTSLIDAAIIDSAKSKSKALDIFQKVIIDVNVDLDAKIADFSDGARRAQEYDARKGTGGITYISTGITEVDEFSAGFKKADLWTIGGSEGVGKTWRLLRMADAVDIWLLEQQITKNVLIISGEMTAGEMEERLDTIRCELSYARLSKGEMTASEERRYKRYLADLETNIKIVDSFTNLKDVEHLASIYRPAIVFIDGSHLLAPSYDWTEIAQVTAGMKRFTRNKKIPILNTTHLKADKGDTAMGGSINDFAYTKGYTRDSDIVAVMYASDMMTLENKVGLDWVKVRRGSRVQHIYESDYEKGTTQLIETKTGAQIAAANSGASSSAPTNSALQKAPAGNGKGRKGNTPDEDFPY